MEAFETLIKHRRLLFSTVIQGMRGRTAGNALGVFWLLLYPLLFLAMYTIVFVHILKVRMPGVGTADYVLTIFCGLVPFLAFSEAFGVGTPSIVANRNLLKNTLFPIELGVARDVVVGHATMGLGILLVWGSVVYFHHLHWTHLLVPFIYGLQILMVLGLVWITSTLTVFFRDLQQATPIIILFLMLVSPIAYKSDMVPTGMKALVHLNPLAWLMDLYRSCLLDGRVKFFELICFSIFSLIIFELGYRMVSKMKPIFADYV